jgi:hypothetical protein
MIIVVNSSSKFVDLILDNYLFQHVSEPTREKNILDLVFTSEEGMVENVEIKEHFSTSDHNIVCWNLITKTDMLQTNTLKYNYSRANYVKINNYLNEIDWETKLQDLDIESLWNTFYGILNDVIVKFVPKVKNKSKKFPIWMTADARNKENIKCECGIGTKRTKATTTL